MKITTKMIATMISGLVASFDRAEATPVDLHKDDINKSPGPISLRPLNQAGDNLFAGHSSHASHASHASHRSGSGGGYSYPTPDYTAPTTPTHPSQTAPTSPNTSAPMLTRSEKLKLQVMRVQIALTSLGLYNGSINGELDDKTKESLRYFQTIKGLDKSGLMTTETLNALGVPAVQ